MFQTQNQPLSPPFKVKMMRTSLQTVKERTQDQLHQSWRPGEAEQLELPRDIVPSALHTSQTATPFDDENELLSQTHSVRKTSCDPRPWKLSGVPPDTFMPASCDVFNCPDKPWIHPATWPVCSGLRPQEFWLPTWQEIVLCGREPKPWRLDHSELPYPDTFSMKSSLKWWKWWKAVKI